MSLIVMVAIVLAILFAVLVAATIAIYNRLVRLTVGFTNAFSQIDVQLKRRYDLIPNLVEAAQGYMTHERQTLEAVIMARNQAAAGLKSAAAAPGDVATLRALGEGEGRLRDALGRLFVVIEAYPKLKASKIMMQFTEELTSTENRISFARQSYNDAVLEFNGFRRSFPPVVFASRLGFKHDAAILDVGDRAALLEAPKVKC